MKTPYFYIIKHTLSQKYYAGCKINSLADSSNLMTEKGYKTTSKIIKNIIKIDGLESFEVLKIKHFNFANEALYYESKFLQKVNAAENPKFINLHNGGKNFVNKGGYKLSDSTKNKMKKPKSEGTIKKQNKEKRNRSKEVYEKMVNTRKNRYDTWHTESQIKAISEANKKRWSDDDNVKKHSEIMKDYYKNNPITEEAKEKKREASKGDRNGMFGKTHNELTKEKMKLAWEKRKENKKKIIMTTEYYWLNKDSRKFLERGYLIEGEDPEQRVLDIANTAEKYLGIDGFAKKFEGYMAKGFYSLSSPIWSNFGRKRGLPISCFGSYIPDTMSGILGKLSEVGIMTKMGGGTSAYFGELRGRGTPINSGGESTGSVHFMELYDKLMNVVSQGNVRRGSFAAYLPIDHPDIEEFLKIRGDGHEIQEMSIGVCVSNEWMHKMIDGDKDLRKIWGLVIKKRFETGYPYIFFSDNANDQAPQVYKDKGLKINNSNLCSEIFLSNKEDESFVCNLSSINLERWDAMIGTDAIETLVYFLDAVMTEFIDKTEGVAFMEAPRKFAMTQRALGVGVLGWHSLLQAKLISFESIDAKFLNIEIWKTIREKCDKATKQLADMFGEPELLKGYGRRNSTTIAVAPTTSSSFILGQISPSIEPLNSNYFTKDLAKGKFTYRNPYLLNLLKEKNMNTQEIWKDILSHGGSVQHLSFFTQEEKDVFKTFGEISQKEIVIQAAQRQKYIDQGQSLNIMVPASTKPKDINELMIFAWEQGIKSLYYQRSSNPSQELARSINACSTCES